MHDTPSAGDGVMTKAWGSMTASERMAAKLEYLQYNYGHDHPLVVAAAAGDIAAFRDAGAHITEMMDCVVVGIIDAPDAAATRSAAR